MLETFLAGFLIAFAPGLIVGVLIGMSLYWRTGNW
jgi:ABC-type nitrate/sulfonate/bicarbonate transport system permease component